MGFHKNGIRVIMDVVFNHTAETEKSAFNLEVPGYYYRQEKDGSYSNASGCGNETSSERIMMRKFIIESCLFWAHEYKIDGFRFDLMGIHDIETLNLLSSELKKADSKILLYGEGWTADSSPLPKSLRAIKENTPKLNEIACFNDDIRDAVKGNVFEAENKGFVSGAHGLEEIIKFGVAGATFHPQINYKLCASNKPWASSPSQSVNYVSCHDNLTLYDKLIKSTGTIEEEKLKRMYKLANAIILTSQGIPFLQSGVELLRTKSGEHNTYNLPDEVNQIDWDWKTNHNDIYEYCRNLIMLRNNHPAFRMPTSEMIAKHLEFFHLKNTSNIVAYSIKNNANNDSWKDIVVIYNATDKDYEFQLPDKKWFAAIKGSWVVPHGIEEVSAKINVPYISAMILFS
jgi:pullulanase